MVSKATTLFYTSGASDKIYKASLSPVGNGWVVNYEYGKRDTKLKSATKTASPVNYEDAEKIYTSLIKSKKTKGYTEEESGNAYAGSDSLLDVTGFQPQLLNSVDENEIESVTKDWAKIFLQVKHDGERRAIYITTDNITASNRRGLRTELNPSVHAALIKLQHTIYDSIIDCEDLGAQIMVFDVLRYRGMDIAKLSFAERVCYLKKLLIDVIAAGLNETIGCDLPEEAHSVTHLKIFLDKARMANAEGIVIRNGDAKYTAGRPASHGSALKVKFVESATLKVSAISSNKRSVSLQILDGVTWIDVGKCSIPSNRVIPQIDQLVEVEYLYAYRKGSLFQPVYKGCRNDLTSEEATISQLKYKAK